MGLGFGGKIGPFGGGVSTRGFGVRAGPFKATSGWGGGAGFIEILFTLFFLAVAVMLAIAVGVLAGFGYGLVLIYRGVQAYRGRRQGRPALLIAGGLVLSVGCGALIGEVTVCAVQHCTETPPPPPFVMPNLVGRHLDVAEAAVKTEVDSRDLSPLARYQGDDAEWTVLSEWPAAGTQVPVSQTVVLYVLRNSEYRWFKRHPTMPTVPRAASGADLTEDGGPLADVRELVSFYTRMSADSYGTQSTFPTPDPSPSPAVPHDPSVVPASERAAIRGLTDGFQYDTVVGQVPRPGTKLRPGQVIGVLTGR